MLRAVFGAVIALTMSGACLAADQMVVLAATVADGGLTTGTVLNASDTLNLKKGDRLTLIAQDGEIVQLDGPFSGPVSGQGSGGSASDWPDGLARVAGLVAGNSGETNVLGATRKPDGRSGIAMQPDFWLVNADSSGERCVPPARLELWRRDAGRDTAVVVRGERERLPKARWAKGAQRMTLPKRLARDRDRLLLSIDKQPRRYTLHVLPAGIDQTDWGAVLRWMVDKDCKRQAVLLIDKLHVGGSGR